MYVHTLIPLLHFCLSIVYMYPFFFLSKCAGDINAIYLPSIMAAAFKWLFCAGVMQGILCLVPLFVVVWLLIIIFFFSSFDIGSTAVIIATIGHDKGKEKESKQNRQLKVQAPFLTLFGCENCIVSLRFFFLPTSGKGNNCRSACFASQDPWQWTCIADGNMMGSNYQSLTKNYIFTHSY